MKEQILEKILLLISSVSDKDITVLSADDNLITDVGLSSYDIIQLIWSVEQEFGISVPTRQLNKLTTADSIAEYILRSKEQ